MYKLLLATIAVSTLAVGGVAQAADLPPRVHNYDAKCGTGSFQGWYGGIHGGAVGHFATRTDQDAFLNTAVPAAASYSTTNVTASIGGQFGYNFQCRNAVIGIEIDGSWVGAKRTLRILPNFDPTLVSTLTNELDALVTLRLRAGVVAADSLLVYVTGGLAGGSFRTKWSVVDTIPPPLVDEARLTEWSWGVAVGFGAEWAFWRGFSVRAETLYLYFPERELSFTTPNFGTAANVTHADSVWITRLGLNYRFGG
jgi:outer membrane immunogenic protein